MTPTKLIIVDDHELIRMGITLQLKRFKHMSVIAEAGTGKEFFEKLETLRRQNTIPNLALVDVVLPDTTGIDIVQQLRNEYPTIKILILSAEVTESVILELTELGIDGFINKGDAAKNLPDAIDSIMDGVPYYSTDVARLIRDVTNASDMHVDFTDREIELIRLCCQGLLSKEIADHLNISTRTVDTHKNNIFKKLNINNTVELMRFALRRGFIKIR